jgi:hypothetical protein
MEIDLHYHDDYNNSGGGIFTTGEGAQKGRILS